MFELSAEEQLRHLKKGVVDLVEEKELLAKLKKSVDEKKPLRIKVGFDPSRPDLHIGHTVVINKMRQWQDLGHQVIFIVGDFTAMIGDPTGKNETRPALTRDEVVENAKSYAEQCFKILDRDKTELVYNATWLDAMSPSDFIRLSSQYTVARMLERDDFSKRYQNNQPISIHEFMYPLAQAYDSVAIKADVEMGGTDQRFNLLVGRDIQKSYGVRPQSIMTMPLLEGLDGVKKMSKSYDNYIGVDEIPREMFGKTMRVSDELMYRYLELLTDMTVDQIESLKTDVGAGKKHPRDVKVGLAKLLVERFHSKSAADQAEEEFNRMFQQGGLPDDLQEKNLAAGDHSLVQVMVDFGMASSKGEARRLMQGGGVQLDGSKVMDPQGTTSFASGDNVILKVGKKKFVRILVP
ncbi:MAG: tyrosine--tRNA ligase [Bdellovibrionaceae bacterium]|nr:tyrosine--tRNA ligase [Pseudobdellovibrionaceae bacterium]